MNVTLAGETWSIRIPDDPELLRGPLARLKVANERYMNAGTLLEVSHSALVLLVTLGELFALLVPDAPGRAVQAATLGELDDAIEVACHECVARHGDRITIARLN